jgi:hypothetical protein
MNDLILNVQPQLQKILFGQPWDAFLPPLVGSFFGVLFAFLLDNVIMDNYQKFIGEYFIKAELSGTENDLRAGGRPQPIEPVYGADYVRENRLFGENTTQIIFWYKGFDNYNRKLKVLKEQLHESDNHDDIQFVASKIETNRRSMANQIEGMLRSGWLKRIPDDMNNSGLSKTKFVWYLLKQDALEEPTRKGDFRRAIIDKLLGLKEGEFDPGYNDPMYRMILATTIVFFALVLIYMLI